MVNFDEFGDAFYTSRDGRIKIYHDRQGEEEHHLVIDDEDYVPLVRGTLRGVGRGDPGALGYVMDHLTRGAIAEHDVACALVRGRVAELEEQVSHVNGEIFELQQQLQEAKAEEN